MSLRFLFIDFNSFFASVEQTLRPELRGRPVAVLPVVAETTCCIAASLEAKRHGVKTGTPVYEARRLCPDIVLVEARPRAYVYYHHRLKDLVDACLPIGAVASIDEMYCELWGQWCEPGPARKLAQDIKKLIEQDVGPHLTSSIGLAPNVFLAKTASDMEKPDGLVVIEPKDLPACLYRLELRDFCGIGKNMESRLRRAGITTVRQLCDASRETLRDVWGGIEGERFHDNLRGKVTQRAPIQRRTLGHSHILPPNLRTEEGARAVLHRLVQKAAMRLRSYHGLAGGMGWFMRFSADQTWSDEIEFAATDDTFEFVKTLETLWQRRLSLRVTPIAVGMTFFHIIAAENHTPSLFGQAEQHRRHSLLQAIDNINGDTKRGSRIYFGGAQGALEYTPMRIAFNRIPDPATEN